MNLPDQTCAIQCFFSLKEEITLWKSSHDCLTQWILPVLYTADKKIRQKTNKKKKRQDKTSHNLEYNVGGPEQ